MPAAKNPNNGPANAARTRKRLARLAEELRAAGWTVTPPPEPAQP